MSNYGFESSAEIEDDRMGFPLGEYRVMATDQEDVKTGIKVDFRILSGDKKDETFSAWYNTMSENTVARSMAQRDLKRLGDASGSPVGDPSATHPDNMPIKGRIFCVSVVANAKNPKYVNVTYNPAEHITDDTAAGGGAATFNEDDIPF